MFTKKPATFINACEPFLVSVCNLNVSKTQHLQMLNKRDIDKLTTKLKP